MEAGKAPELFVLLLSCPEVVVLLDTIVAAGRSATALIVWVPILPEPTMTITPTEGTPFTTTNNT